MNWSIEISKEMYETLLQIFEIVGFDKPLNITAKDMKKVLNQMQEIINSTPAREMAQNDELIRAKTGFNSSKTYTNPINVPENIDFKVVDGKLKPVKIHISNALIISNLGVIRYQLRTVLNNQKIEVETAENLYRGLAEYVKRLYSYVIVDLNNSYKDAIDITKEINSISEKNNVGTVIIALTTTPEILTEEELASTGISKVIVKNDNWYDEVLNEMYQTLNPQLIV